MFETVIRLLKSIVSFALLPSCLRRGWHRFGDGVVGGDWVPVSTTCGSGWGLYKPHLHDRKNTMLVALDLNVGALTVP